jgi:hypothetical protein
MQNRKQRGKEKRRLDESRKRRINKKHRKMNETKGEELNIIDKGKAGKNIMQEGMINEKIQTGR